MEKAGDKDPRCSCDQCNSGMRVADGYAVYSPVLIFGESPMGGMLICEECANNIFTKEAFNRPKKYTGKPLTNPDDLHGANAEGMVALCKRFGLSPEEARVHARNLAIVFADDRSRGQKMTEEFWTKGPNSPIYLTRRPT
jgi:hypothetical protein